MKTKRKKATMLRSYDLLARIDGKWYFVGQPMTCLSSMYQRLRRKLAGYGSRLSQARVLLTGLNMRSGLVVFVTAFTWKTGQDIPTPQAQRQLEQDYNVYAGALPGHPKRAEK